MDFAQQSANVAVPPIRGAGMTAQPTVHDLTQLPAGALLHGVSATPVEIDGRAALRVSLADDIARNGIPHVDFIDMPTFVRIPSDFANGTIAFDVRARLTSTAPDYARGFVGLAYRINTAGDRFECVYLRPLNGRRANPPSPRHLRAVQYFAYPDWTFDRLRDTYPDGRFEAGADIGPDEWIHARIDVDDRHIELVLNGITVWHLAETPVAPGRGDLGLWVDIGTEAHFSKLTIRHSVR